MSCFLKSEVFDGLWAHDESLPTRSDQPSPPGTPKGYFLFSMLGVIFSICQQPSLVLKKKKYLYGLYKYHFPKKNTETVFSTSGFEHKKKHRYIPASTPAMLMWGFLPLFYCILTRRLHHQNTQISICSHWLERCTVSLGLG